MALRSIWLPSCLASSLLRPAAASGVGQRPPRQGGRVFLWHWDRWPGCWYEAAYGPRRPGAVASTTGEGRSLAAACGRGSGENAVENSYTFAGSGKTYTAALVAVGLYKRIGSTKPVIIFDTEKAAKFLKPLFAENNIPVLVKESRSLADLKTTMQYMRQGNSDILIVDSISHVWENFLQSYGEKVRRTRLQFQDWGIIKPTGKAEFSDPFVRDPYHVIMCGRSGYEYENEINPDTKVREIYKSGVKMKVEGETAYEPDMLVLMERFEEVLGEEKKVWREATILKDRSTLIDGKTFKNPTYESFAPSIEAMMADPSTVAPVAEGNAGLLFRTEEEKAEWKKERDRAIEEIEGLLTSVAPGQPSNEKKFKVDALFEAFGTTSWTAIQQMHPDELKQGYDHIRNKCVEMGLAAYQPDQTITTVKKVEVKDDPAIDAEVAETVKKSKPKGKK